MHEEYLGAEKQPPEHWEEEFGFEISNPIGWARRGIEFERELTADAFNLMASESIVKIQDWKKALDTGAIELPDLGGSENE